MNQLSFFEKLTEVTDENLPQWILETGETSPIGQLLVSLEQQAPRGFLALLNYRADGNVNAEQAVELINNAQAWLNELARHNIAQLEDGQ